LLYNVVQCDRIPHWSSSLGLFPTSGSIYILDPIIRCPSQGSQISSRWDLLRVPSTRLIHRMCVESQLKVSLSKGHRYSSRYELNTASLMLVLTVARICTHRVLICNRHRRIHIYVQTFIFGRSCTESASDYRFFEGSLYKYME